MTGTRPRGQCQLLNSGGKWQVWALSSQASTDLVCRIQKNQGNSSHLLSYYSVARFKGVPPFNPYSNPIGILQIRKLVQTS